MEGQRRGSALVLNDYMGLKLMSGGKQEADARVIQSQKVSRVDRLMWVWTAVCSLWMHIVTLVCVCVCVCVCVYVRICLLFPIYI